MSGATYTLRSDTLVLDLAARDPELVADLQEWAATRVYDNRNRTGWWKRHRLEPESRPVYLSFPRTMPKVDPERDHEPFPEAPDRQSPARVGVERALAREDNAPQWKRAADAVRRWVSPTLVTRFATLATAHEGTVTGPHVDGPEPDELTVVLSLHRGWRDEWGGWTVVPGDPGRAETTRAVAPRPGTMFVFPSDRVHYVTPIGVEASRARGRRIALTLQMMGWPAGRALAHAATPDRDDEPPPAPHVAPPRWADGRPARLAALVRWALVECAATGEHTGRTAHHAVEAALRARAAGADETTAARVLGVALAYWTRTPALAPLRDRRLLEHGWGRKGAGRIARVGAMDPRAVAKLTRSPDPDPPGEVAGPHGRAVKASRRVLALALRAEGAMRGIGTGPLEVLDRDVQERVRRWRLGP